MPFLPFLTVCLAFFLFSEVLKPKTHKEESTSKPNKLLIELTGASDTAD